MSYHVTVMILLATMIFSMYAQYKVRNTFERYRNIMSEKGLSGKEAARIMLDSKGMSDVRIEPINGYMTDHYDPTDRVLRLSEPVYAQQTVAALSVACHEAGHAVQHERGYFMFKLRSSIVPVANFASRISFIMIILGIVFLQRGLLIGNTLYNVGILCFIAIVVFHLVTLVVEIDASRRAVKEMTALGILIEEEQYYGYQVLKAAAFTYLASLLLALAQLLRFLAIRRD